MIVLSYFTKKFIEEIIEKPINEKSFQHLNDIIKDKAIFFLGNKENYRKIFKEKKNFLKEDNKKRLLLTQFIQKSTWINIQINLKNVSELFRYLNIKNINLDFIYSSSDEREKKIGEIKYLKKKTLEKVISPKRIEKENKRLFNRIERIQEEPHTITYNPSEEFKSVILKSNFKSWYLNINKLIFVSDEVIIYDRYIAKNFLLIKNGVAKYNRNSEGYFQTLEFISKSFLNTFVSKNQFNCKILCVFPTPDGKSGIPNQNEISDQNRKYLNDQIIKFINTNETKTSIKIKDSKLWNNVHERYFRFYMGGTLIKVIKFNPGFDFIKKINHNKTQERVYEFDNVRKLDIHKKEQMFDRLLRGTNFLTEEKTA